MTIVQIADRAKPEAKWMLLSQSFGDIFTFRSLSGRWGAGWQGFGDECIAFCGDTEAEAWMAALGVLRSTIRSLWDLPAPTRLTVDASETSDDGPNIVRFPGSQRVTGSYLRDRIGEVWVRRDADGAFQLGCVARDGLTKCELGRYRQEVHAWLAGITFMECAVAELFKASTPPACSEGPTRDA